LTLNAAKILNNFEKFKLMDVYIKIYHQGKCFRSKTIARGGTDFKFKDEVFFLNVDSRCDDISLEVYGEDSNKDESIGVRKL
jgi:Ca2+-dependent lipid-binding protein